MCKISRSFIYVYILISLCVFFFLVTHTKLVLMGKCKHKFLDHIFTPEMSQTILKISWRCSDISIIQQVVVLFYHFFQGGSLSGSHVRSLCCLFNQLFLYHIYIIICPLFLAVSFWLCFRYYLKLKEHTLHRMSTCIIVFRQNEKCSYVIILQLDLPEIDIQWPEFIHKFQTCTA